MVYYVDMRRPWLPSRFALSFISLLILLGSIIAGSAGTETVSTDEIVQRLLAVSNQANKKFRQHTMTYSKTAVMEQVTSNGTAKGREEKLYQVRLTNGRVKMFLLQVNGKPVSAHRDEGEVKPGEEREIGDAPRGEERPLHLTSALLARYIFTLVGSEQISGRPCHVLRFEPKQNLREKGLVDRFLNQVEGRVWVDASEGEIARAELRLRESITLWGGVLGALKRFDYTLERTRLDSGLWFNRVSQGDFELRKLFSSKRFRTQSEWQDLVLEPKR